MHAPDRAILEAQREFGSQFTQLLVDPPQLNPPVRVTEFAPPTYRLTDDMSGLPVEQLASAQRPLRILQRLQEFGKRSLAPTVDLA